MIPERIHFIWYGLGKPIPDSALIGIRTALLHTTCKIILHTDVDFQMEGVEIRKITLPQVINGVPFKEETNLWGYEGNGHRISHVKDIKRLEILYEEGGIYSDMDVLWLRNPIEFFNKKVVIGWSNKAYKVLINCVMMAEPKNDAIKRYLEWVTSIYPPKKYWTPANPYKLWKDLPDICYAERYKFCVKPWNKLNNINWADIEKSVCLHLCHSLDSTFSGEVAEYLRVKFAEKNWSLE